MGVKVPSSFNENNLYVIEEQAGFLLRRAHQRSSGIFQELFINSGLTPMQFTSLVKIRDEGHVSQNLLGRLNNADPATIMGIVNRLVERHLIQKKFDPADKRKSLLQLTDEGLELIDSLESAAHQVSKDTLKPLSASEQKIFLNLLARLT
tara:strand:+ start:2384 stop:2833 length:450 start_codon:yes stop_codon:yes gene_type:complete